MGLQKVDYCVGCRRGVAVEEIIDRARGTITVKCLKGHLVMKVWASRLKLDEVPP